MGSCEITIRGCAVVRLTTLPYSNLRPTQQTSSLVACLNAGLPTSSDTVGPYDVKQERTTERTREKERIFPQDAIERCVLVPRLLYLMMRRRVPFRCCSAVSAGRNFGAQNRVKDLCRKVDGLGWGCRWCSVRWCSLTHTLTHSCKRARAASASLLLRLPVCVRG